MNFSKTASYSMNILSYMATHEELKMSAAYLHEKLGIPYPYLRQILKNLSRKGFIRSTRGRSGGFAFRKAKNEIYLADILEATDGLESINKCILGFGACPFNNECSMHTRWEAIRNDMFKILQETSLADILAKQ
jgi:Rrf2 family transcriptional regulator, iron-sulfur cluster assembly transcription factor